MGTISLALKINYLIFFLHFIKRTCILISMDENIYIDLKANKARLLKLVLVRSDGKMQFRCTTSGIFVWRYRLEVVSLVLVKELKKTWIAF
ncbi:hypothetical protein CMI37_15165 [Candidatus Pacearchaeota archaeon]|nr:hypothetical protein [Candidatus Pacearchaeota archaeon]